VTGSCSICQSTIEAIDTILDAQREAREVKAYLDRVGQHFMTCHPKEYRTAASVGSACVILTLLIHITSTDARFTETFTKIARGYDGRYC